MSMSSYVYGIKPADEKYQEMLEVFNSCQKAKVRPPKEVTDFFGGTPAPDPVGVTVTLMGTYDDKAKVPGVKRYKEEMSEGYEIDIRKLPDDIKIIRFVNSW